MTNQIIFPDDHIVELLKEAKIIQNLGEISVITTNYEGSTSSDDINSLIVELKDSMKIVLGDLHKLNDLTSLIDNQRDKLENDIQIKEKIYNDFVSMKISELENLKKEFDAKITSSETSLLNKLKTEQKEVDSTFSKQEKDVKKVINEAEKDVKKVINEAEKSKDNLIKNLTKELDKTKKIQLKNKYSNIDGYKAEYDTYIKNVENYKIQIPKKEDEINKLKAKYKQSGKPELKERGKQLSTEVKTLRISLEIHIAGLKGKQEEIDIKISRLEEIVESQIKELEEPVNIKINQLEKEFNEIRDKEIEKLNSVKSEEEGKFMKLKESRISLITEFKEQEEVNISKLKAERDNTINNKDLEMKGIIKSKQEETDEIINQLKAEFDQSRKSQLLDLNKNLSSSVKFLTDKISELSNQKNIQ